MLEENEKCNKGIEVETEKEIMGNTTVTQTTYITKPKKRRKPTFFRVDRIILELFHKFIIENG